MRTIQGREVEVKHSISAAGVDIYVPAGETGIHLQQLDDKLHMIMLKRLGTSHNKQGAIITCFSTTYFSFTGKYAEYKDCTFRTIEKPVRKRKVQISKDKKSKAPARAVRV